MIDVNEISPAYLPVFIRKRKFFLRDLSTYRGKIFRIASDCVDENNLDLPVNNNEYK